MKFSELDIIPEIQKAIQEKNYKEPTPIQEQAIPLLLKRNDLLGCAQTGTGKTAAFAIPIIQNLFQDSGNRRERRGIKALVLTPTRELAIQIEENFTAYSKYTGTKNVVIFGGVKQGGQVAQLNRGCDVLIATPGRLLDLIQQEIISLDQIKYFVLDEADRMLDMGFIHDVNKVIKLLPKKRQSLFFSATMPMSIVALSATILNHPEKVEVTPVSSTAETVKQYIYYTNKNSKKELLLYILRNKEIEQALVFSRTKHGADRIQKSLVKNNITAAAIHGDKSQNNRQKSLNEFKDGNIRVLVATDIAARGIDIDKLKYVINYDIPNESETYVHRIGRSGRAGEEGIAISICEPEELSYVKGIERLIKKKLWKIDDNPFPQTDKAMNKEEKKEFEKEKQRRKQEFFANRKKKRENGGGNSNGKGRSSNKNKSRNKRKRK